MPTSKSISKFFRKSISHTLCILSPINRATILSIFLRFVLILKYYVLENITVLISKKCLYLWFASLIFLIFCSVTILNKEYLINIQTTVFLSHRKHVVIKVFRCNKIKSSIILQHRDVTHYQALLVRMLPTLVRILRKAGFVVKA